MSVAPARYFVTRIAWPYDDDRYATDETYRRAATWLGGCQTVADWGGAAGYFRRFLPPGCTYTLVDGTTQATEQVVAELTRYRAPSDGILLRHVLDCTPRWEPILKNALLACRQRIVVVTFLEEAAETQDVPKKHGWPYRRFAFADLRAFMGPWLVHEESVETSHHEHVFYLERPC